MTILEDILMFFELILTIKTHKNPDSEGRNNWQIIKINLFNNIFLLNSDLKI
jgi:hypothetical protein